MAPRLLIMTLLIVLGGSGVLAGAPRPADRTKPTIKWHKSLAAAKAASRESGLLIFAALCTADRPSHSLSTRIMRKEVFRTEQFKKWAAQHVVLWDGVRTEAEPSKQWREFVGRNAIGNAITVMLIDADENRLASTAGYKSGSGPKPLIDWANRRLHRLARTVVAHEKAAKARQPRRFAEEVSRQFAWHESLVAARTDAKDSGLPILVLFFNEEPSAARDVLEKEVFQTEVFKQWAVEHVVLSRAGFMMAGEGNRRTPEQIRLRAKYALTTTPTVMLLDADGQGLARRVGYQPGGGPEAFISWATRSLEDIESQAGSKRNHKVPPKANRFEIHKTLAAAKAASRQSGMPILGVLSAGYKVKSTGVGSRMDKEVFQTDQFKRWAKDHVVLWSSFRSAPLPARDSRLPDCRRFLQENGISGITVMLIDADENRLARNDRIPALLGIGPNQGEGYKPGSGPKPLIDWLEHRLRKLERGRAEASGKELQPADQGDAPPKTVPAAALTTGTGKQGSFYPRAVEKELYAGTDLRGREAPPLEVDQWLGNRPETEGMVVLVDLYRTTSKPCRDLVAKLNDFQRKYRDDLVVIALSDEQPADLHEFIRSQMIDYAMGVDSEGRLIRDLAVEAVPHVLVISSDGVVRWQGYPFSKEDPLTNEVIAKIIDAGR